jgi:hypothetical protein
MPAAFIGGFLAIVFVACSELAMSTHITMNNSKKLLRIVWGLVFIVSLVLWIWNMLDQGFRLNDHLGVMVVISLWKIQTISNENSEQHSIN